MYVKFLFLSKPKTDKFLLNEKSGVVGCLILSAILEMMKKFMWFSLFLCLAYGCKDGNTKSRDLNEDPANLKGANGDTVRFPVYDYEGLEPLLHKSSEKTYVLNFWATWCKPCVKELPDFEKIYADYKDKDVELVLISLDMPSMWKSKLEPFVDQHQLKGTVVILDDPKMNDWIPKVDPNWGGGIPATLIYNGEKREFYERGFTYTELKEELEKFL